MNRSRSRDSHQGNSHRHRQSVIDPKIAGTERGKWAIKRSFAVLMVTALLQMAVVTLSDSVALLADTLHNFGDAFTALPLWIAFSLIRRKPSRRFTYGMGRLEDLAGVIILLMILASAVAAGYESVMRFFDSRTVKLLWVVAAAALIGFIGNELVARFRIKVGREIKSAALEADGHHARVDGLTSLSVLFSALGVWLGFPLADPVIGLLITVAILRIVWDAGKSVLMRLLDGVDPDLVEEIRNAAGQVQEVLEVSDVRARWIGHRLYAEVNLAVAPDLSVADAHEISQRARHEILHRMSFLSNVLIHIDPGGRSGEAYHRVEMHEHGNEGPHRHP